MRDHNEIAEKVYDDWVNHYAKQTSFDRSNSGDMMEKGVRDYIMNLLDVHSCTMCGDWFVYEHKLTDHLKEKHNFKIVETDKPWRHGYCDYGLTYYIFEEVL